MRTVQMTLDNSLVDEVDRVAKKMSTSRSSFTRDALRAFLKSLLVAQLEQEHRRGYKKKPIDESEQLTWEGEQHWGDNDDTW